MTRAVAIVCACLYGISGVILLQGCTQSTTLTPNSATPPTTVGATKQYERALSVGLHERAAGDSKPALNSNNADRVLSGKTISADVCMIFLPCWAAAGAQCYIGNQQYHDELIQKKDALTYAVNKMNETLEGITEYTDTWMYQQACDHYDPNFPSHSVCTNLQDALLVDDGTGYPKDWCNKLWETVGGQEPGFTYQDCYTAAEWGAKCALAEFASPPSNYRDCCMDAMANLPAFSLEVCLNTQPPTYYGNFDLKLCDEAYTYPMSECLDPPTQKTEDYCDSVYNSGKLTFDECWRVATGIGQCKKKDCCLNYTNTHYPSSLDQYMHDTILDVCVHAPLIVSQYDCCAGVLPNISYDVLNNNHAKLVQLNDTLILQNETINNLKSEIAAMDQDITKDCQLWDDMVDTIEEVGIFLKNQVCRLIKWSIGAAITALDTLFYDTFLPEMEASVIEFCPSIWANPYGWMTNKLYTEAVQKIVEELSKIISLILGSNNLDTSITEQLAGEIIAETFAMCCTGPVRMNYLWIILKPWVMCSIPNPVGHGNCGDAMGMVCPDKFTEVHKVLQDRGVVVAGSMTR